LKDDFNKWVEERFSETSFRKIIPKKKKIFEKLENDSVDIKNIAF